MTELERKALMGDKEAQEECTRKGIVLPCPWCRKHPTENDVIPDYAGWIIFHDCKIAGAMRIKSKGRYDVVLKWNTRPAPPVGRCGECKHWADWGACGRPENGWDAPKMSAYDFCSRFEPKGDEENA